MHVTGDAKQTCATSRDARRIATNCSPRPVSGLAGGTSRDLRSMFPSGAFPCACTVADAGLVSLTVAGAAPDWMREHRHRLPVSILGQMPSDHLEACAL